MRKLTLGCVFFVFSLACGACLQGCVHAPCPISDWRKGITSDNVYHRIEAAVMAASQGELEAVPYLIRALEDEDVVVRFYANMALKRMTGQDFGFFAEAPLEERNKAILRWWQWWEGHSQSSTERSSQR